MKKLNRVMNKKVEERSCLRKTLKFKYAGDIEKMKEKIHNKIEDDED